MKRFASVFVFCVAITSIFTANGWSACQIWRYKGAGFYWVTNSNPSAHTTLTMGPCGQRGEAATAYIYSYLDASDGLCDYDYETPCGSGNNNSYTRYAKIKVTGKQEAFQNIFPEGLYFWGCKIISDSYQGVTVTQVNKEYQLELSTSPIMRIDLDVQPTQCLGSYSGSKFEIEVRFFDVRESDGPLLPLNAAKGSLVVRNNPRTSFDPLAVIPDFREGSNLGWIEKQTHDLTENTDDNRWKVSFTESQSEYCQDITDGIDLRMTSWPDTVLIPTSKEVVRVKFPSYKRDMYELPLYARQDGWTYTYDSSNRYLKYEAQGKKIIYHCDSPYDNGQNDKERYLIRRIESCTPSQEPGDGTDLWYINYTYNSPAQIANIHNGSDPNDPNTVNSATIQYEYDWTGDTATVYYKTRSTTAGTWQTERQWEVTFDDEGRAIKYDAGCLSGCSSSGEFENVTYFDSVDYDLTGYEYLIKEKKDPNDVVILRNSYNIVDYGQWQQADWLPLRNMSFESPIVTGCENQTESDDITGWTIDSPTQTPNVQVCNDPNDSELDGDQYLRPENHTVEKDFQCYLVPTLRYNLSASIKAFDSGNYSRGVIEIYYDNGGQYTLLAAIDVNDVATGELVNGQWENFDVDVSCPASITELKLKDMKIAVTGVYVGIDNLVLASSFWVPGNSKPIVSKQEVYDDDDQQLKTSMTRTFDESNFTVTEINYTSPTEYRTTIYRYSDRTFNNLIEKKEYGSLSEQDPNQLYTTTYSSDDPNRIFVTTYPNGKRADYQIYGDHGNVIESYVYDVQNDANSLRETYTYVNIDTSGEKDDWRIETHTNAYGGVTVYEYEKEYQSPHYLDVLKTQTDPNDAADQQQIISYTYDDVRRVIRETRKLDSERNLRTSYNYNSTTGFLDSMTANDATTSYQYNTFGQEIRQSNPDGVETGKSYGQGGELVSEFVIHEDSDPNNADTSLYLISQTRHTYTASGKVEFVGKYKSDDKFLFQSDMTTNPGNWIITKCEYYKNGRKKKVIEDYGMSRKNLTTEYFYNLQGELKKVLYPTGKWVQTYRDGRGLVTSEETGHGTDTVVVKSVFNYDANGNLIDQLNPDGSSLVFEYDNYDRLKYTYQGSEFGPYTERFYNAAGNVVREVACEGDGTMLSDSRTEYDNLGNVIFERLCFEPNSIDNNKDFTSHYEYDIAGNLRFDIKCKLASTEPNAITTEYRYNNQGRQSTIVDPNGFTYSKYYTNVGLVYKSITPNDPQDPNAYITLNDYDAYGRLVKTTNPEGHYIKNTFNSLGQLTKQVVYDSLDVTNPNDDFPVRQTRTVFDNLDNITQRAVMADPNESGNVAVGKDLVTDFVFDPNGVLSEQKVYVGLSETTATTTFSYDKIGRLILTTDPEDNTERIYYNATDPTLGSQITKVEQYENDPNGSNDYTIRTFLLYDDGRLSARILDKDGDDEIDATDPNTSFTYDGLNRITHTTAPDDVVTFTAYDGFGNVKQTIEDYGIGSEDENRKTEFVYNCLNQQYQVKAYDPNDTTSQISIQTTEYEYNENGLVTKIIYPDNRTAKYAYNLIGKVDAETRRDGSKIYYWYDQLGNVLYESDDPDGPDSTSTPEYLTEFSFDGAGQLTYAYKAIAGAEVSESWLTYNGFGAQTSETVQYDANSINKTTTWTYDGAGNQLTQAHGSTTLTFTHDGLGRIETISKGNDQIVTYDYIGRNTEAIDYPEADTTQLFAFDKLGRVTECKSIDVNSLPILDFDYTYDKVGNRETCQYSHLSPSVYDVYKYDSLRRLKKVTYADENGVVAMCIDGNPESMDNLVLFASAWVNGQEVTYNQTDPVLLSQRLEQMESLLKEAGFRNIDSFLNSVKTVRTFAFNPDDPIYTFVVLPGDVPKNYTTESVLNDNDEIIAQIIWDNKDRIVLFAMYPDSGDTIVASKSYDSKGNLITDTITTFDADGNVVSSTDMLATQQPILAESSLATAPMSMASSSVMMSSTAEAMEGQTDEFGYDHLGNRTTVYLDKGETGQETLVYNHNIVNQYSTFTSSFMNGAFSTTHSLSHDYNGNLSVDELGNSYSYDYRNRLIEVEDSNSVTHTEYIFDALGRRIYKTVGSDTTFFFYDTAGRVIAEYADDTTPTLTKEYVWGNGINEILAMFNHPEYTTDPNDWTEFLGFCAAWLSDPNDTSVWSDDYDLAEDDFINFKDYAEFADVWEIYPETETRYYYLRDALGSIRGLVGGRYKNTDDREFYNYDVYGKLAIVDDEESKSGNPYLFAGYRYDAETEKYHTKYRTYEPSTGRWLQFDPIGYADGMSLYEYVASNPIMYIDAFGLKKAETLKEREQRLWEGGCYRKAHRALGYWHKFIRLRMNKKERTTQKCRDRFLCIIRAVSWVESKHGTAGVNYPEKDPMQAAHPDDTWWRSLTGQLGRGDRFIGGPDKPNFWVNELSAGVTEHMKKKDSTGRHKHIYDISLIDPKLGHRDKNFNPDMSYFWGVPYLIHSINTSTKGGKTYNCGDCSEERMINGAIKYNGLGAGAGDPRYGGKIRKAVELIGCMS